MHGLITSYYFSGWSAAAAASISKFFLFYSFLIGKLLLFPVLVFNVANFALGYTFSSVFF